MRVDANVAAMAEAPLEASVGHALCLARRGHAVDRRVGLVVEPLAVLDFQVSGVDAFDVAEGPDDLAFVVFTGETVSFGDFARDQFF